MGYFSLPENKSKKALVDNAIANLNLWNKVEGREGYEYLLGMVIADLTACYCKGPAPSSLPGKISECSILLKKTEALKEELISFVQDKSNPISDRFKVYVDMYDAGIICHDYWVVSPLALYCNDYERHEVLDVFELTHSVYPDDPRSIDLLFNAVDACIHTFELNW